MITIFGLLTQRVRHGLPRYLLIKPHLNKCYLSVVGQSHRLKLVHTMLWYVVAAEVGGRPLKKYLRE